MFRKTILRSSVLRGCMAIIFAAIVLAPRFVQADACTASSIVFQSSCGLGTACIAIR